MKGPAYDHLLVRMDCRRQRHAAGRWHQVTAKRSRNRVVWHAGGWLPIYYGFCPSEKAWKRQMRLLGFNEPYPKGDLTCTPFHPVNQNLHVLVTVDAEIDKLACAITLAGHMAHEAMHVWRSVRKRLGERKPSAEFEAYAIQEITINLLTDYRDTRPTKARF